MKSRWNRNARRNTWLTRVVMEQTPAQLTNPARGGHHGSWNSVVAVGCLIPRSSSCLPSSGTEPRSHRMDHWKQQPLAPYATTGNQTVESSKSAAYWAGRDCRCFRGCAVGPLILLALARGWAWQSVSPWPGAHADDDFLADDSDRTHRRAVGRPGFGATGWDGCERSGRALTRTRCSSGTLRMVSSAWALSTPVASLLASATAPVAALEMLARRWWLVVLPPVGATLPVLRWPEGQRCRPSGWRECAGGGWLERARWCGRCHLLGPVRPTTSTPSSGPPSRTPMLQARTPTRAPKQHAFWREFHFGDVQLPIAPTLRS